MYNFLSNVVINTYQEVCEFCTQGNIKKYAGRGRCKALWSCSDCLAFPFFCK